MRQHKHIYIALFGTFLEYFDYALYGFSALIIATVFFPPVDNALLLLQSFSVFAIGHFAKPLGAIVFGHIGDTYGRARALRYNMLGIALPTLLIGLLPGYQSLGMMSVVLLIFCRFMQGFFVSGEYDGVMLYVVEHFKDTHKCFASALICMMSMTGFVLASFFIMQLKKTGADYADFLWRLPFIIGGLLGILMLYLRKYLVETDFFTALNPHKKSALSFKIIKEQLPCLVVLVFMFGAFGGLYHFTFVFFEKFMVLESFFTSEVLSQYHFHALMCFVLFSLISGVLGDKYGARSMALLGGVLLTLCWVFFIALQKVALGHYGLWLGSVAISMSLIGVQIHIIAMEFVQQHFRYRMISLGHTIGAMLFSGTTPVFVMLLYRTFNHEALVYIYPIGLALTIITSILIMNVMIVRKIKLA